MNAFLSAPGERLSHWKQFRRELPGLDRVEQMRAVAIYWSHAPIGVLAYDPNDAGQWLTPWEMIYKNQWCRSSVAIGMENTLRLSGISADRLTLQLITDKMNDLLLVLIIDDTFVLNYAWGSVHLFPLIGHDVIRQWRFAGHSYFQLNI